MIQNINSWRASRYCLKKSTWAEKVNMFFNYDKFEALRCWPVENRDDHHYKNPANKDIEEPSDLKDLGVRLSTDLSFTKHVQQKLKTARRQAGWVLRTFRTRSVKVMMTSENHPTTPGLLLSNLVANPAKGHQKT